MALPTSGEMNLYMIADEFNVPRNTPLMDFYRGDGIVPNIPANSSVPTSGPISFFDFYGASNIQNPVEFSGAYNHVATYSGTNTIQRIGVRVLPNGRVQHMYLTAGQFGASTYVHNMGGWIRDFPISESAGANYEVQFQHYMQDPTGWFRLDTFRDFYREASGGSYQMTVRVRERGNTSNTAVRSYSVGANKV